MSRSVYRVVALLACAAATSAAQQPPLATETLDEVTVAGSKARERERIRVTIPDANDVLVSLDKTVSVLMRLRQAQAQVAFRRKSAARQLPEFPDPLYRFNQGAVGGGRRPLRLELLPDRVVAAEEPGIMEAAYLLAGDVDEADGIPAHIPFGKDVALVNLDYVSLRAGPRTTRITVTNALDPLTRKCERDYAIPDYWPDGPSPYVLMGSAVWTCDRAVRRREGDLLFAESVPGELRKAVKELHDPIAAYVANRLGAELGTMFVAWWKDSPHAGYRLEQAWNRDSLLLFNGAGWQKGIDATQREALRLSLMREQIQRQIRESDSPGPFTRSAVEYLLLLTRGGEDHTTSQRLRQALPGWISLCAGSMQQRADATFRRQEVSSLECGLVLHFVYDAVARAGSAGRQDAYNIWHKLLDVSFRRGGSGARTADFLASSAEARKIGHGLVDGSMDWMELAAALDGVGVKLAAISGETPPVFEVRSLEHFQD